MSSRLSGSEALLATMACARMPAVATPRLLIGGLGMGFTLRAALDVLPAGAAIAVIELVAAVVEWARGPLVPVFGASLDDARVEIVVGDVGDSIAGAYARFDAILLDVDNGPDGLTRATNDRLYDAAGLLAAKRALRPGGVLAIWSAAPDAAFRRRLDAAGFVVEEAIVRANAGRGGARHVIWFAVRRS
jgi:spermidine synthase